MGEFRVGSTSYLDPYRTGEHEEQKRRKREHHDEAGTQDPDDEYVASSDEESATPEAGDFYAPSRPASESE